jgi:NADPH:quinone reductase-like Zn-dependent oxidoreductase
VVRRLMARDGQVVVKDEKLPPLGPGDVLVRAHCSVVSPGTERSIVTATAESLLAAHEYPHPHYVWPQLRSGAVRGQERMPRVPPPDAASLGYSLAGVVEQVGNDVTDLLPGDRVACSGSQCAYHAEQVVVPRNLVTPVPDRVPLSDAAHVTLGAIALEAFRRTECTVGETVLIVGAGMLGLLLTQIASRAGVYVVALDAQSGRRELAAGFGAQLTLPVADATAVEQVHASTGGFGADAAIIAAAGRDSALVNFSLGALRPGGRVVALGDFGMDIDRQLFFRAQATFVPSIAYGPGRYDPVYEENNVDLPINVVRWTENRNMALFLRLLADGHIDLAPLPRAEVEFADAARAYEQLFASNDIITAVLRYPVADT